MIAEALAAMVPELAWLDARIALALSRLRARYELSLDELRGLYVSDQDVDALLHPDALLRPDASPADDGHDDIAALRARAPPSPWTRVAEALHLGGDERDLLLACVAPELDPKYETLYAYLNNDVNRAYPTAELAARLFARDAVHGVALHGLLAPDAPLLAAGAIEFVPGQHDLARGRRALRVAPPLAAWLRGLPWVDERLAGMLRPAPPAPAQADAPAAADRKAPLAKIWRLIGDGMALPPLVLVAGDPLDAAGVALGLYAQAGRTALSIDLAGLAAAPAPAEPLAAAALMQNVLGVGIVATPVDALVDADGHALEAAAAPLRRLAAVSPALMLGAGDGVRWRRLLGDTRALELRLPEPDARERRRIWSDALGKPQRNATLDALADRFVLGRRRIAQAAAAASCAALLCGTRRPTVRQLFAAAREVSADGSGGNTSTVATPFGWNDLMLPGDVRQRLSDLVRAIELRYRVLDEWGFAARVGVARGIKAMFAGPSGTGKTLAAGIVARTLGLELQRIELAAVTSKYIGETEKNLDRAFAAARRANAVLFIDEADALLGKRSEVKDAHDRYANIETAYLLQKMEDHDGIVIVATNLAKNIDEAFARRMQFVIEFPVPDAASRDILWRRMFPPQAPLAADIDFAFLARQFTLAGGDIRNIVLDAAYRAAQGARPIGMPDIVCSVARHNAKRGKVSTAAEFREYFPMLAAEQSAGYEAAPAGHGTPAGLPGRRDGE